MIVLTIFSRNSDGVDQQRAKEGAYDVIIKREQLTEISLILRSLLLKRKLDQRQLKH